jgi:glycosyltransferase involved in cell wall biosynthesis
MKLNPHDQREKTFLSAVVPIALERGPFSRLLTWLPMAINEGIQIILVLDFSESTSESSLQKDLEGFKTSNVIIVSGFFGSPGLARNAGLEKANGKWVVFWDVDDEPNIKETLSLARRAELENAKFAIGSFEWRYEDLGIPVARYQLGAKRKEIVGSLGINPGIWRFAFLRESLKSPFDSFQMAEDQVFILKNCDFAEHFTTTNELVYSYISGGNSQQTQTKKFLNDLSSSLIATRVFISSFRKDENARLASFFFMRQIFTGLKRANISVKTQIMRIFLKSLIQFHPRVVMRLLVTTVEIFKIKNDKSSAVKIFLPLTGGLGNQLFQLAAALSLAHGKSINLDMKIGSPRLNAYANPEVTSFVLPANVELKDFGGSNLLMRKASGYMLRNGIVPRKFERFKLASVLLNCSWNFITRVSMRRHISTINGRGVGYFDIPKFHGSALLYGYFQSFRWPSSVRDQLMSISPRIGMEFFEEYRKLAAIEMPLIVHIRLGDYKNEPNFGLVPKKYYSAAVDKLWSTGSFKKIWLFSDEPEVAMSYFEDRHIQFIRTVPDLLGSSALTLQVMRLGHGYIIGNSTYGWWGAYLSFDSNSHVIAPTPWFKNLDSPIDLIPPDWELIGIAT